MNVRPVVYDTSGKYHAPAPQGSKLDYDLINVDELVSGQANNALSKDSEGRLFVNGVPPHVSKEPWNYARFGNDHGIFVGGNDVLSNSEVNLLTIADGDKKVVLPPDAVTRAVVNATKSNAEIQQALTDSVVTTLRGNTDAKDAVTDVVADAVRTDVDTQDALGDVLVSAIQNDAAVKNVLDTVVTDTVQTALKTDQDFKDSVVDLVVGSVKTDLDLQDAVADLVIESVKTDTAMKDELQKAVTVVSTNTGNAIVSGTDKGAFLAIASLIASTVENALKLDNAGKLLVEPTGADVLLVPNDPLLSAAGKNIISTIGISFDELTGKLTVTGAGGRPVTSTLIPASVEMLEAVNLVENPIGQAQGTYIHWVFKLTDERKQDVFLNVNKLVDIYTGGNGISVVGGVIAPVLYPNGGLGVDAQGLYVSTNELISTDTNNMLVRGSDNKLSVIPGNILSTDANNALKTGADGKLYLNSDDVAGGVSADAGNALIAGSDGRAYLPSDYGVMP